MIFLKLFLISGLTFFTAMVTDGHLSLLNYIRPIHYNVLLKQRVMPYDYNNYDGECNIIINILQATNKINFHSKVQIIFDIELTDKPPKFKNDNAVIVYKPYLRDCKTQIIELFFLNKLPPGRYILKMKFVGNISDNGGFKTLYSMENKIIGWIAATHFEKTGARRLFPCWDEPELKATFNISIQHNKKHKIFSNMPVKKIYNINNLVSCTQFLTTPALSTYLVTAGIIRFDFVNIYHITYTIDIIRRLYVASELFYAEDVIKNMSLYLESEWKRSKIITRVNHIAIPIFRVRDMVFSGLVLYRESDILYNNNSDPIARKIEVEYRLKRNILKEWFFNMLNSSSLLNEALISLLTINIINNTLPNSRIIDLFVVQIQKNFYLETDEISALSRTNKSVGVDLCTGIAVQI